MLESNIYFSTNPLSVSNAIRINELRVHRDGYIQTRQIELIISPFGMRRAAQAYSYLSQGYEAVIEDEIGIRIEGVERIKVLEHADRGDRIMLESNWQRPTRR